MVTTNVDVTDSDIILYRLHGCPYCERVVNKLQRYGLEYHSRFVTPEHSTRDVVKRRSGSRTVPVLIDRTAGITMSESANINHYLEQEYND